MQIKIIPAEDTRELRHKVLRPHQSLSDCLYPGDNAATTFHVGAMENKKTLCVATFLLEKHTEFNKNDVQYRLRGMATDPSARGRGVGSKVLKFGEEKAQACGAHVIWFNARESAFPFYLKQGFMFLGEFFDIAGIGPHRVMFKNLN